MESIASLARHPIMKTRYLFLEFVAGNGREQLWPQCYVVNVIVENDAKQDLTGWQGPVSFPEQFQEESIFGFSLADFRIAANWEFNGQFIANFNVLTDGTIDPLSSLDVAVTTLQANLDNDVAVMPYHIDVKFHNLTGGTETRTFRAKARGDGGGESSNI